MRERIRAAVLRAAGGEFVRGEVTQRAGGERILEVDFSMTPVLDDQGRVVLLIPEGRDVSALKAAQRSETAMLRALATIGESAALMAHEIKNPITAINVALRAVADALGEDHKAVLEDLVGRMKNLEGIMRRTLSFARPLELKLAECDAAEMFAATIASLRDPIARTGAQVGTAVEGTVRFRADRQLLGEVIANLLSNAVESRDRPVRVVLGASARGGTVSLWVEDDGPGVPEDQREAIFKPFFTTKGSGTGLGLAICRKIIEEHGGSIVAESGARGGARFQIRLKHA